MRVQDYLTQQGVPYEEIPHLQTIGAQHLAQALDVSGEQVAKSVLVTADGQDYLALVPASSRVDLGRLREALGANDVELATEAECGRRFADSELGAYPPFGSQHQMLTIVDRHLADCPEIIFEGNTHREAIRMAWEDFRRLEIPVVADIARKD